MTIDEAIKHCIEVAEKSEKTALRIGQQYEGTLLDRDAKECRRCAADHRQLAEWLRELKELRGREQKIYDELAFLYGSPCNFSPQDEVMLMRGRCEDCCGDISDAECWQRYFSVRLGGEQNASKSGNTKTKP